MNKEIAKKNAELLLWMAEAPGINKCIDNTCVYFVDQIDGLKFCNSNGGTKKSEWITDFLQGDRRLSKIKPEPKSITWQEAIVRILDGKPVTRKDDGLVKAISVSKEWICIPDNFKEIEWLIPPE